jgi:hypothetical protein
MLLDTQQVTGRWRGAFCYPTRGQSIESTTLLNNDQLLHVQTLRKSPLPPILVIDPNFIEIDK